MTDEQIETKIEHVKNLMALQYRMANDRMDRIENRSENADKTHLLLFMIILIVIIVGSLSITSTKKGPEPKQQLEQVK